MKFFSIIIFFFLSYFTQYGLYSQLLVAPTLIHLSDAKKSGHITVQNNSDKPREYEIDLNFGYPVSDDSGNVSVKILDTISGNEPSAVKWVRFYPRQFVLQPSESQTIRVIARPPLGLIDGEYWVRPSVLSKSYTTTNNNDNTLNSQGISANIGMDIKIFIALNYRKGKVNTGVSFINLISNIKKDKLLLVSDLKRVGNSAFLGNIVTRLKKQGGEVVSESIQDIAVYHTLKKRVELDIKNLPSGIYTAEIELNTKREEQGGTILQFDPISKSLMVSLPEYK